MKNDIEGIVQHSTRIWKEIFGLISPKEKKFDERTSEPKAKENESTPVPQKSIVQISIELEKTGIEAQGQT